MKGQKDLRSVKMGGQLGGQAEKWYKMLKNC